MTVEIEVRCEPEDVKAIADALTALRIELRDSGITQDFAFGDFKPHLSVDP